MRPCSQAPVVSRVTATIGVSLGATSFEQRTGVLPGPNRRTGTWRRSPVWLRGAQRSWSRITHNRIQESTDPPTPACRSPRSQAATARPPDSRKAGLMIWRGIRPRRRDSTRASSMGTLSEGSTASSAAPIRGPRGPRCRIPRWTATSTVTSQMSRSRSGGAVRSLSRLLVRMGSSRVFSSRAIPEGVGPKWIFRDHRRR